MSNNIYIHDTEPLIGLHNCHPSLRVDIGEILRETGTKVTEKDIKELVNELCTVQGYTRE